MSHESILSKEMREVWEVLSSFFPREMMFDTDGMSTKYILGGGMKGALTICPGAKIAKAKAERFMELLQLLLKTRCFGKTSYTLEGVFVNGQGVFVFPSQRTFCITNDLESMKGLIVHLASAFCGGSIGFGGEAAAFIAMCLNERVVESLIRSSAHEDRLLPLLKTCLDELSQKPSSSPLTKLSSIATEKLEKEEEQMFAKRTPLADRNSDSDENFRRAQKRVQRGEKKPVLKLSPKDKKTVKRVKEGEPAGLEDFLSLPVFQVFFMETDAIGELQRENEEWCQQNPVFIN